MWKIDTCKMWSLGVWDEPLKQNPDTLDMFYTQGLMEAWLKERLKSFTGLEVRSPLHKWSVRNRHLGNNDEDAGEDVREWHQDGTECGEKYLGMWSNLVPTDVKVKGSKDTTVYRGVPGEFLIIDNHFFVHREPSEITPEEAESRWFARFSTNGPVKQHKTVRECTL